MIGGWLDLSFRLTFFENFLRKTFNYELHFLLLQLDKMY